MEPLLQSQTHTARAVALAASAGRPVGRSEFTDVGISKDILHHLASRGLLARVRPGWYAAPAHAAGPLPPTPDDAIIAAVRAAGTATTAELRAAVGGCYVQARLASLVSSGRLIRIAYGQYAVQGNAAAVRRPGPHAGLVRRADSNAQRVLGMLRSAPGPVSRGDIMAVGLDPAILAPLRQRGQVKSAGRGLYVLTGAAPDVPMAA